VVDNGDKEHGKNDDDYDDDDDDDYDDDDDDDDDHVAHVVRHAEALAVQASYAMSRRPKI
jgi:hypothetical protein